MPLSRQQLIGRIAHREDHHPELHLTDDRFVLRWATHSVGGTPINDFICAASSDAVCHGELH